MRPGAGDLTFPPMTAIRVARRAPLRRLQAAALLAVAAGVACAAGMVAPTSLGAQGIELSAGGGISWLDASQLPQNTTLSRWVLGVSAVVPQERADLVVGARLALEGRGSGYSSGGSSLDMTYLEIPLLVGWRVEGGAMRTRLFAGPVASFVIGCTFRGVTAYASEPCEDVTGPFGTPDVLETKAELAIAGGFDVHFRLGGRWQGGIEGIVSIGLVPVLHEDCRQTCQIVAYGGFPGYNEDATYRRGSFTLSLHLGWNAF
jgi:hypothetical protein